jgi:hypothetical protein
MKYTPEQFNKLPKWARDEMLTLRSENGSLKDMLSVLRGESETNTYVSMGLDRRPIENNASVDFHVGPKQCNRVSVRVDRYGNVDFNTDSRMGHTMVLMPRAANAFHIAFIDR